MLRTRTLLSTSFLLFRCSLNDGGQAGQVDGAVDAVQDAPTPDTSTEAAIDAPIDVGVDAFPDVAPEFLPTQVLGCQAWYRADLGVTVAAGVSQWSDQSGAVDVARNALQPDPMYQPSLTGSDVAYNGKATLGFASSQSQSLHTGIWSVPLTQPYTVMIVGQQSSGAFVDGLTSTTNGRLFTDGASYTGYWAGSVLVASVRMTSPSVAIVTVNGPLSAIYLTALTPQATGAVGVQTPTGLSIGADWIGTSHLQGKIAEIGYWNRAVSPAEISVLMGYAGKRYGMTIGP
jgi:hypothetical protein